MALFTDGPLSSIDDLTAQDSQVLEVASGEGIDLTRKSALAQEDLGVELTVLLNKLTFPDPPIWNSAGPSLGNVVVTPALKLWHRYLTLEMVYRDAYNSQLNDRYAGKRDQFHLMAQWASEKLIQTGVGITARPLPRALMPQVTAVPGALADGTYFVTMAWTNQCGEEGGSAVPALAVTSASTFQVQPGDPPENATGWNVYAGAELEAMVVQNTIPIGVGETWQQPPVLTRVGRSPGSGQEPNYFKAIPRLIQRG